MADIESLTASLVREYLSRKGLKKTLQVMDQEIPRNEQSISNRAQLAKEIHIEKLMKKNKVHMVVYRTMLEVIVQHLKDKEPTTAINRPSIDITTQETRPVTPNITPAKISPREMVLFEKKRSTEKPKEKTEPPNEKQDYSELLSKLERSERIPKVKEPNDHRRVPTHVDVSDQHIPGPDDTPLGISPLPKRSHRSRLRSAALGGPVISSGLAGIRDKRPKHTKSQAPELSITGHKFHTDKEKLSFDDTLSVKNHSFTMDHLLGTEEENVRDFMTRKDVHNSSFKSSSSEDNIQKENIPSPVSSVSSKINYQSRNSEIQRDELVFEDIDDDLNDSLDQLSLGSSQSITADFDSKPISLEQAMALKNLIFGSATGCFNQEWRQQSFNFCDCYGLEYGIVQHKGGSCGVLAAVQAFVLKHLLFGEHRKLDPRQCLQPSGRERRRALALSITEILWRAGNLQSAIVALPTVVSSSNFIGAGRYKPDKLTENLVLRTFVSHDSLHGYITQQVKQFEEKTSSGCILLLYSSILSRTIKGVISDMDDPNNKLMGSHGYCSQEMVNLIITGSATSNAFDDVIELDSGGTSAVLLKGIEKQADVGLLSLFEHYGSCQVGMNYKTPKYPIWVICSESHFSVLFSIDKVLQQDWEEKFDVYYYDGLSRQEEEIMLTVDTSQECPEHKDEDLVPPLELVIRTRWKKAVVDWNGSEPIL